MPSLVRFAGPGVALEASSTNGLRLLRLPLPDATDSSDAAPCCSSSADEDENAASRRAATVMDQHPMRAIDVTRFVHLDYDCAHDNCKFRPCGLVSLAVALDADGIAHVVYVHAGPPNESSDGVCTFSLRVWRPVCLPKYRAQAHALDLVALCGATPPPYYCRPAAECQRSNVGCSPGASPPPGQPTTSNGNGDGSSHQLCDASAERTPFLTYEGKPVHDYTTRATLLGITAGGHLQFSVVSISCVADKPFTVCGGVHRAPVHGALGDAIGVVGHPDVATLATVLIDRGHRGTGFTDVDCQHAGFHDEVVVPRRVTSMARHPDNLTVVGTADGFVSIVGPAATMPFVTPTPLASPPKAPLRFVPVLPMLPVRAALESTLTRALFARTPAAPLALVANAGDSTVQIVVRDPCRDKKEAVKAAGGNAAAPAATLAIRGTLKLKPKLVVEDDASVGVAAAFVRATRCERTSTAEDADGTVSCECFPAESVRALTVTRDDPATCEDLCASPDDDDGGCCPVPADAGATVDQPLSPQPQRQLAATVAGSAFIVASGPAVGVTTPQASVDLRAMLRADVTLRCDAMLPPGCVERPTQLTVHGVGDGASLLLCVAPSAHCQPLVLGLFGTSDDAAEACTCASVADAGLCHGDDVRSADPVLQCAIRATGDTDVYRLMALHASGAVSGATLRVNRRDETVDVVSPLRVVAHQSGNAPRPLEAATAVPWDRHVLFVGIDAASDGTTLCVFSDDGAGGVRRDDCVRSGLHDGATMVAANADGVVAVASRRGDLWLLDLRQGTDATPVAVRVDNIADNAASAADDGSRCPPHGLAIASDGTIAVAACPVVIIYSKTGSSPHSFAERVLTCWRPPTTVVATGPSTFAVGGDAPFVVSDGVVKHFASQHSGKQPPVTRFADQRGAAALSAVAFDDATIAVGAVVAASPARLRTGVFRDPASVLDPVNVRGTDNASPALMASSNDARFTALVAWHQRSGAAPATTTTSSVHVFGTMLRPVANAWTCDALVTAVCFVDNDESPVLAVASANNVFLLARVSQTSDLVQVSAVSHKLPGTVAALLPVASADSGDGYRRVVAVTRQGGVLVSRIQHQDDAPATGSAPSALSIVVERAVPHLVASGLWILDAALPHSSTLGTAVLAPPGTKFARSEAAVATNETGSSVLLLARRRESTASLRILALRFTEDTPTGVIVSDRDAPIAANASRFGDVTVMQHITPAPSGVESIHWNGERLVNHTVPIPTTPAGNGVVCRSTPGSRSWWVDADDWIVVPLRPDA